MIVGIHQPHFFPWLGYLDKIAKSDRFVLLDQVQFEKGSQMIRNRVLDNQGNIKYLTIPADTKDFLNREYRDIKIKDYNIWRENHKNALKNYYRKAKHFDEVFPILEDFYSHNYQTLFEWTYESIKVVCRILSIDTQIILQSNIEYNKGSKKSDLVMEICKALNADTYLSGKGGSVHYLDKKKFALNGIAIIFQKYVHPTYKQCQSDDFKQGLSVLDVLFNCGIDETANIFWRDRKQSKRGER